MRKHLKIAFLASTLIATLALSAPSAEAGGTFGVHIGTSGFGVSVGVGDWGPYTSGWTNPQWSLDFNATLSGYGEWVWVGNLGRVWRPWVAVGWRPYTYGRWVRTTLGWTWVAYEPWGYVPHHYGSWAMCAFGWVWVPGYSYSSASVVWVRSGGYVGWYPRPPRGWSHAARGYRHGYRDGYRDGWNDARYATYVDWRHMASDNVSHYAVRHTVAARHQVQDNAAAPTTEEIRRRGGVSMPEAQLSQRTVTVNGRRLTVARPEGVARSIEHHAAGTAAEALSPRALEHRQPSVRSARSSSLGASQVQSDRSETSSDRPLLTGGRHGAPDQPTHRGSATTGDRRENERMESSGGTSAARRFPAPQETRSIGGARERPSLRSIGSDRGDRSSITTDSRRDRMSTPSTRPSGSTSSARSLMHPPARTGSASSRSASGTTSVPRRSSPGLSGAGTPSRSATGRTRSAGGDEIIEGRSGGSAGGLRRQAKPREKGESESTGKKLSTRRSATSKKRSP